MIRMVPALFHCNRETGIASAHAVLPHEYKDMVHVHLSLNRIAISFEFTMQVLVTNSPFEWFQAHHPEVVVVRTNYMLGLFKSHFGLTAKSEE